MSKLIAKSSIFVFILLVILFIFISALQVGFAADHPVISNVQAVEIIHPGAQITWTTDDPSDSRVLYGTASGESNYNLFSDARCDGGGFVTSHCVNLTNLTVNTVYYYKVESKNVIDLDTHDGEYQFTSADSTVSTNGTGGTPSTPPPVYVPGPEVLDFGYFTKSDGSLSAGVTFDKEVDQSTLTDSNVYIIDALSSSKIDGYTISYFDAVEYITNGPAVTGVDYQLIVKKTIKDLDGNEMAESYTSPVFQAGGGTYPGGYGPDECPPEGCPPDTCPPEGCPGSCPDGSPQDPSGSCPDGGYEGFFIEWQFSHPQDGATGVGTDAALHITFNHDISQDINYDPYLVLTTLADPTQEITGEFFVYNNGFDFIPSSTLEPDTTYTYQVSYDLQAPDGTYLDGLHNATFTTGGGVVGETAEVKGKVTNAQGVSVSEAYVEVHTSDYILSRGSGTSPDGTYNITNIPAGSYILEVFPPQNDSSLVSPDPIDITLAAGEVFTKDFSFVQAVKFIKGKVVRVDGQPVTDGGVSAWQPSTNKWAWAPTDSNGNYRLSVSGGEWEVSVKPESFGADWAYNEPPKNVSFATDTVLEEVILDFTVVTVDGYVTGKILMPDGTPVPDFGVYVSLQGADRKEFGGDVRGGIFNIPVVAGTYDIFIGGEDRTLTAPDLASITVATGETIDLGTIQLIEKSDKITGTVTGPDGSPVVGVRVNAWAPEGYGFAESKTDNQGVFELAVTPGTWEVNVEPDVSTNFYNPDPIKQVTVTSGVPVTVNFILKIADSGISGRVIDSDGQVLANLYGFAELTQTFAFGPTGIGGPIDRGKFSFKAPAGVYLLITFFPAGYTIYSRKAAKSGTCFRQDTLG